MIPGRVVVTLGLLIGVVTGGCRGRPKTALIGWTVGGTAARRVAQAVIDSTHRPQWPRIELTSGPSEPVIQLRPNDFQLVRWIDIAARLAAVPNVVAVVGPAGSREALLAGPIYREAGLPFAMPTANAPQLSRLGPLAVQMAAPIDQEGGFIAEFAARRLHATTAVIFYVPDEWGTALQEAVALWLWFYGVRVTRRIPVATIECRNGTNDLEAPTVATLRSERPDVIILATRTMESRCIVAAAATEQPSVAFVAGDGTVLDPALIPTDVAERFYAVAFWSPDVDTPESKEFRARFRRDFGREPSNNEAMMYDAAMLLVQAIREVGPDRRAIAAYLASLGEGRPPYRGISGPITRQGPVGRRLHMVGLGSGTSEPLIGDDTAGVRPTAGTP